MNNPAASGRGYSFAPRYLVIQSILQRHSPKPKKRMAALRAAILFYFVLIQATAAIPLLSDCYTIPTSSFNFLIICCIKSYGTKERYTRSRNPREARK
jgi:hypothetical protein